MHPCFSLNYCLMRKVSSQATFWNTSDSLWILKYLLRNDKLQLRHLWKNFVKIRFSFPHFVLGHNARTVTYEQGDWIWGSAKERKKITCYNFEVDDHLIRILVTCFTPSVDKTERNSRRQNSSRGVKKRARFGSGRVRHVTRPNLYSFFYSSPV